MSPSVPAHVCCLGTPLGRGWGAGLGLGSATTRLGSREWVGAVAGMDGDVRGAGAAPGRHRPGHACGCSSSSRGVTCPWGRVRGGKAACGWGAGKPGGRQMGGQAGGPCCRDRRDAALRRAAAGEAP